MRRFYPESMTGRRLRQLATRFGTERFIYLQVYDIIPGPYTLKRMELNEWLKFTNKVKVDGRWYREYQVDSRLRQWADEETIKEEKKEEQKRLIKQKSGGTDRC